MLVTNSIKKDPRVRREAEYACRDNGTEVVVVGCNDPNYDGDFCHSQEYRIEIYNLPIKYKTKLNSRLDKAKRAILPMIGMYKICVAEKPDVVHANDLDTLPTAIMVKRKIHCRVIYDSHEIYTEQPSLNKYPVIKKMLKQVEKACIKDTDAVLSVSHAAAKELEKMYGKRPFVVTNCSMFFDEDNLPEKNPGFEIIYHGMINRYRGYEEFARASRFVDEGVLVVLRGFGDVVNEIEGMIKRENLVNARIEQPVEIPELVPCAAKSMVGAVLTKPVSENYRYTVSNKIFEYIQARIPVIMSDVPEHRYLNEKYHIGIIVRDITPNKIAEAINSLYRDKGLYEKLYNNVRIAAKELCWEREFEKLKYIYNNAGN